jgi:tetratricopeptide (TPR) repeat protein/DNA-binding MarR family transcriptional regulator
VESAFALLVGGQTYLPIEILDYVQTHVQSDESPFGISQKELARALGYHPCSMSRPLDTLVGEGLLAPKRKLVRDGVRKQITYSLTEEGRIRLRKETKEVPILSGEIPAPPHPFLGRRDELAQLAGFVRGGGGTAVFIDGAPGMGKTALVSRHLRETRRGRVPLWFTVRGASTPRHFVSALARSLQALGARQLAYYAQLPRPPTAKEVADLASRSLGDRQLVVVVDDTQLAASELRRFLREFTQGLIRGGPHRLYFISQESAIFELDQVQSYHLTIGGLDRASAHDLTDRGGGLADRFEAIFQSTLGSPLLLHLAVRNPDVSGPASALPSSVLRRLPVPEFEAILPLAIANEPLPLSFLTEDETLTAPRVLELTRMGILHRTLQGQLEILQVVRTATLNQVRPNQEKNAHLRLASYFARSHRPDSVRLRFVHLVEGESWKAALQLLTQQEKVLLSLGYSDAVRGSLRHLATVLPRGPSRLRALGTEVKLLRQSQNYTESISSLRRAIEEADHDPALTCQCLLSISDILVRLRQLPEARAEFAKARKIGPLTRRLQAFISVTQARLTEAEGGKAEAERQYKAAFEYARKAKITDLALESIAAWTRLSELYGGRHEETLQVIASALPEARAEGRMDIVFNLLLVRCRAYAITGRTDEAQTEMELLRSEAESLGYVNQLAYALSGLSALATRSGRLVDATNYAKQAITLAERLGNDEVLGATLGLLSSAEFRAADQGGEPSLVQDSIVHGERSVEILSRLPHSDSLAASHAYLVESYLHRKNQPKAIEHYEQAAALADELGLDWLKSALKTEFPGLGPILKATADGTVSAGTSGGTDVGVPP